MGRLYADFEAAVRPRSRQSREWMDVRANWAPVGCWYFIHLGELGFICKRPSTRTADIEAYRQALDLARENPETVVVLDERHPRPVPCLLTDDELFPDGNNFFDEAREALRRDYERVQARERKEAARLQRRRSSLLREALDISERWTSQSEELPHESLDRLFVRGAGDEDLDPERLPLKLRKHPYGATTQLRIADAKGTRVGLIDLTDERLYLLDERLRIAVVKELQSMRVDFLGPPLDAIRESRNLLDVAEWVEKPWGPVHFYPSATAQLKPSAELAYDSYEQLRQFEAMGFARVHNFNPETRWSLPPEPLGAFDRGSRILIVSNPMFGPPLTSVLLRMGLITSTEEIGIDQASPDSFASRVKPWHPFQATSVEPVGPPARRRQRRVPATSCSPSARLVETLPTTLRDHLTTVIKLGHGDHAPGVDFTGWWPMQRPTLHAPHSTDGIFNARDVTDLIDRLGFMDRIKSGVDENGGHFPILLAADIWRQDANVATQLLDAGEVTSGVHGLHIPYDLVHWEDHDEVIRIAASLWATGRQHFSWEDPSWECSVCAEPYQTSSLTIHALLCHGLEVCVRCADIAEYGPTTEFAHARADLLAALRYLVEVAGYIPPADTLRSHVMRPKAQCSPEFTAALMMSPRPSMAYWEFTPQPWSDWLSEAGLLGDSWRPGFGIYSTANDGHLCRSMMERMIDDYMTASGIAHEHEPEYPAHGRLNISGRRADWKLSDGTLVEAAGLMSDDAYRAKMEEKIQLAAEVGINLLVVTDADMGRLQEVFAAHLPGES